MRKVAQMFIVFAILSLSLVGVQAVSVEEIASVMNNESVDSERIGENRIEEIPLFITFFNPDIDNENQVKEQASVLIRDYNNYEEDMKELKAIYEKGDNNSCFSIVYVSGKNKAYCIKNPLFSNTFSRAKEMISNGVIVNSINLFIPVQRPFNPDISLEKALGDPSSESYWILNTSYWGSIGNYNFRYTDSSMGIETAWVTPENLSSSWNWQIIINKAIEASSNLYKNSVFLRVASLFGNAVSDLTNIYTPPLSVSYSSSGGYFRSKVSGDHYIRNVYINDVLNRVPGYAYYNWGTLEYLMAAIRIDAKWPKGTSAGAYIYEYPSYSYSTQAFYSDGFNNTTSVFQSIIQLYENTTGHFLYSEIIDVDEIVFNLLS